MPVDAERIISADPRMNEGKLAIALFDLDGVLVENPDWAWSPLAPRRPATDWEAHWNNWASAKINHEMVQMMLALDRSHHRIIILTGRPAIYETPTRKLLARMGIVGDRVELVMFPSDEIPRYNAFAWKQQVIGEWLDAGLKIAFLVEDYKPNAEAARCLVPVLLYERKKVSEDAEICERMHCRKCGGLARCYCRTASEAALASPIDQADGCRA